MNGSDPDVDRPILETERLVFRPFRPDDLPRLQLLHRDPQVGRYMGGVWPDEKIAEALDAFIADQAQYGHAKWAAFDRQGEFVGRAGVSMWEDTGELEIGYVLRPKFWGRGLATEAARAIAAWTFAHTGVGHVIGFTHPENRGSMRVLERIGMTRLPDCDMGFDEPSTLFRMDRP